MSFVGTRPEAVKYVEKYKEEYMAKADRTADGWGRKRNNPKGTRGLE